MAPRGSAERPSGAITAIGVGYGTDAASQRAGELARWLKPPGCSLRLTQVAHTSIAAEASERPAKLEGFDELNVLFGSVRGGPLELADRVDLLVIGLHRRSAIGRLLRGSTADALQGELPCPLLAVPELPLHVSIGSTS